MASDERRRRGSGSAIRRGDVWRARWRIKGKTIERTAGPEEADAIALLKSVERLVVRGGMKLMDAIDRECGEAPRGTLTFKSALDLYLDARDAAEDLRASTRDRNRGRAGILREAPWAPKPVAEIGRKEVRAWAARRAADGVSGKAIVNDLVLASSVFKWLDDEQMIDPDLENPFLRARPKRFHRMERRALEETEILELMEGFRKAAPDALPLYLAAVSTGWRIGELCALTEADLDLGQNPSVTIGRSREKTGRAKTAVLCDPLLSILHEQRRTAPRLPSALLFTDRRGKAWTPWTRADRMARALAAVPKDKIPAWKREGDTDHLGIDWHTLRHSFRSLLSARGHRPAVLGEWLGQANLATAARYDHGYRSEARAVAADVARMLSPGTPSSSTTSSRHRAEG